MTTPAPAPSTGWRVTGQTETTEFGPDNVRIPGVTVYFVTGAGTQGSVFVPAASYTADRVRASIAAKAAQLDEVAALSAPPAAPGM